MDQQYVVTVIRPKDAKKYKSEKFYAHRTLIAKMLIKSSSPQKSFIDMLVDTSKQFQSITHISIYNKTTCYQRLFDDIADFLSWVKKLPIEKLREIDFSIQTPSVDNELYYSSINFSINEYHHTGKSVEPKLWKLEIKDFFTDQPIIEKDFANFKKADDFVWSLIDPSHKKFSPSNPCINRDCKFLFNGCDITDYFLEINDVDINCYKIDDAQVFECTEYTRNCRTTIYHVLAVEEHNPVPRLVYSSVKEKLNNKVRERGVSEGRTWDSELNETPMDNLYLEISSFARNDSKLSEFKRYLKRYSSGLPVTSFVCIEIEYSYGVYTTKMREYYITDSFFSSTKYVGNASPDGDYSHLIPPHEKWTYEDFDMAL